MLVILLSWIYIFFTTLNFGILFTKLFRIQNSNLVIHHILGFFLYSILTSFSAFFLRINIEYYISILLINILVFLKYRSHFNTHISSFISSVYKLKIHYKLLFVFLFIITLVQSSTKPYLLDNESYYIQTIKWINEYGYVKGLANLHMFFGQNSAWHTLQAGFNFPFIFDFFNDLNGYLFVLISFFALNNLNNYKTEQQSQSFKFGLILLFTLFLMQFINAPSPDLIIFLIAPYLFYQFLGKHNAISTDCFKIALSLVLFLCFIKVTNAILIVLPIILFAKNFQSLKKNIPSYIILCSGILILFISKNIIISGYILYPIEQINILSFDWKTPKSILEFYNNGTYLDSMNNANILHLNFIDKFKFWITQPKLNGFFNLFYIFLIAVFPFIIFKNKNKFGLITIYILAIVQLCILWNSSPQYRFFFIFIMFLSIEVFSFLFKNKKFYLIVVSFMILTSSLPVFLKIDLNAFTSNEFILSLSTFKFKNITVPEAKSKIETQFSKQSIDKFEFYSPSEDVFFWATGDCDLPCVNKKQVNYMKETLKYIPQQRTNNLKDGFKSVEVN